MNTPTTPTTTDEHLRALVSQLEAGPPNPTSTVDAVATLVGAYETHVASRGHDVVVDEPRSIGGNDAGATPVEVALCALAACQAITYRVWASRLGIVFDRLSVRCEGDYDPGGVFGIDGAPRAGFTEIRVDVAIEGGDGDRYGELRAAVDAHCPVLDVFCGATPVRTTLLERAG